MSHTKSRFNITLSAPVVDQILEGMTPEMELEIQKSVMSNVVQRYLQKMGDEERAKLDQAVQQAVHDHVREVVGSSLSVSTPMWGRRQYEVKLSADTKSHIRSGVNSELKVHLDQAIKDSLVANKESLQDAVDQALRSRLGTIIRKSVAVMDSKIKNQLRAILDEE